MMNVEFNYFSTQNMQNEKSMCMINSMHHLLLYDIMIIMYIKCLYGK